MALLATVAPSGGDYTSLSAAEAGEQQDLTALGDFGVIECEAMLDTTAVTFDGWTTSASFYLEVRAAAGHEVNIACTSGYRMQGANAFLTDNVHHFRFTAIGVISTISSGTTRVCMALQPPSASTADVRVTRCVFKASGLGGNGSHVCLQLGNNNSGSTMLIANNVFLDWRTGGSGTPTVIQAGSSTYNPGIYIRNNTFHNCLRAIDVPASVNVFHVENNLFRSCTTDLNGTPSGTCDYNATDSATTIPGANSRMSQTFTFVDEANDDLHLASGDAGAKGHGVDFSAAGTYPYSTDFDGDTITGAWSIGADWITAGGTTYTLTAESGAFSLAGTAAALRAGRLLTAAQGAFTVAGTAAAIRASRRVIAAPGSFAIAGTAAQLRAARVLPAAAGAFAIAGTDATLTYNQNGTVFTLTAEPGAFAIAGTAAALRAARILPAEPGAFLLAGTAAGLLRTVRLEAESGAFTISGQLAALRLARLLTAQPGAFTLVGTDAVLDYSGFVLLAVRGTDLSAALALAVDHSAPLIAARDLSAPFASSTEESI